MVEHASALHLIVTGDPALFAIVRLSLIISLSATVLAALLGAPLSAWIGLARFRGREIAIVTLNALMGLPPVKSVQGQRFIDFLISAEGQRAIASYQVDGQQLFHPDASDPGA